jgi:hypothetical protein
MLTQHPEAISILRIKLITLVRVVCIIAPRKRIDNRQQTLAYAL